MKLSPMIQKVSKSVADGATVEDLFNDYTNLDDESERESFVMAVLGELAVAKARLEQSQ